MSTRVVALAGAILSLSLSLSASAQYRSPTIARLLEDSEAIVDGTIIDVKEIQHKGTGYWCGYTIRVRQNRVYRYYNVKIPNEIRFHSYDIPQESSRFVFFIRRYSSDPDQVDEVGDSDDPSCTNEEVAMEVSDYAMYSLKIVDLRDGLNYNKKVMVIEAGKMNAGMFRFIRWWIPYNREEPRIAVCTTEIDVSGRCSDIGIDDAGSERPTYTGSPYFIDLGWLEWVTKGRDVPPSVPSREAR
jgi:hypothetical protein